MTSITLFADAEDLRSVVKINASIPWSSLLPYIDSAWNIYLLRYFSAAYLDLVPETDVVFWGHARRAVGPLAVALSADEMSISIGDSGITVQNDQGKRSPASDAKIAAAKRSLILRGMAALSDLIRYALASAVYDRSGCPMLVQLQRMLVADIETFESYVSLQGDYVAFFDLLPLMRGVQERLAASIGQSLFARLLQSERTETITALADLCKPYVIYRCAQLHTSKTTRQQRSRVDVVEWHPVVRPLFDDAEGDGNWYGEMADAALASVTAFIEAHAEELDVQPSSIADDWNGPGKRIFNLYG
ncbi:MAG: hypothetical protein K6B45_04740 [Bacteroidaceae bacterium]|nr:hypothetical protein [Bacteroidaceae bacterium]